MKKVASAFGLSLLLAGEALAAAEPPPPRPQLRATRVETKIDIDGRLDEAAWASALPSPARSHERRQAGERIAAAIATLPAGARAVLLLRDVFELEYDEIAATLAIDLGTVKSRLSRARAAVRARLTAEGVTP